MSKQWIHPSRYIPDNPNPKRSYLAQAANIAKDMRQQLEEAELKELEPLIKQSALTNYQLDKRLQYLISKED